MNKIEEKALRDFNELKKELKSTEFFEYCQNLYAYGLCVGLNADNAQRVTSISNMVMYNALSGLFNLRNAYKEQQEEENARD